MIIGAGVAGLTCARYLQDAGKAVQVLERNAVPGGRIATTNIDGFRCDRGFQVLPTGDPDVRRECDLAALNLGHFPSGRIRRRSRWLTLADRAATREPLCVK